LPAAALSAGKINLQVGKAAVTRLVDTFALGNKSEPVAYMGSSGYLEIAVNKGNASQTLAIGRGAAVTLTS
jgi:S-adenosylmethionine hydrolase